MEQITIKVDSEFLEKLKARMIKKSCKTLSQCARELMDLALRVEEVAENNDRDEKESDMTKEMFELLKSNLMWSLETRFILRYFLEHSPNMEDKNIPHFLEKAKERSQIVVNEMLMNTKNA